MGENHHSLHACFTITELLEIYVQENRIDQATRGLFVEVDESISGFPPMYRDGGYRFRVVMKDDSLVSLHILDFSSMQNSASDDNQAIFEFRRVQHES